MSTNTKNAIADAFCTLAKSNNIDKITVKDIVKHCNISRQSFYYHYQDIIDVIEWSVEREVRKSIEHITRSETREEAMEYIVKSVTDSKDLLSKLFRSQKREFVEKILLESTQAYLAEVLKQQKSELTLDVEQNEMVLKFCSYGIMGLLLEYCINRSTDSRELTAQICRLSDITRERYREG